MTDDTIDAAIEGLLATNPPTSTDPVACLPAQFDAGRAYVWFPQGYGGLDQPIDRQADVDDRLADSQAAGGYPMSKGSSGMWKLKHCFTAPGCPDSVPTRTMRATTQAFARSTDDKDVSSR